MYRDYFSKTIQEYNDLVLSGRPRGISVISISTRPASLPNLLDRHENGDINYDFVDDQLHRFYKDQGKTIGNFKRTKNTRREDIQAALEELGVLAI